MQRPRQRHTLTLTTGQLMRLARAHFGKPHKPQQFGHPILDFGARQPGTAQPVGNIVRHRHMREQRIILEHDVDRPRSWRHMRHVDAVNFNHAFIDTLEPGQHPQQRGLATARGTKEAEQLTAFDIKGQVVDCHHIAKAARYFPDADEGCFGQWW